MKGHADSTEKFTISKHRRRVLVCTLASTAALNDRLLIIFNCNFTKEEELIAAQDGILKGQSHEIFHLNFSS